MGYCRHKFKPYGLFALDKICSQCKERTSKFIVDEFGLNKSAFNEENIGGELRFSKYKAYIFGVSDREKENYIRINE